MLGHTTTASLLLCAASAVGLYLSSALEPWPEPTPLADFDAPFVYGRFSVPQENPFTTEAFELGRRLFYDVRLSGEDSMSCASCHRQELAFTDGLAKPVGLHGNELPFSSMSLVNLLWGSRHFFWNGRATTLEEQVLLPVQDPQEMDQPLDDLMAELEADREYRRLFGIAYGEISVENTAKALATFLRLLISDNSRYDQYLRGEIKLTPEEERGRKLFMAHPDVKVSLRGGNCIDCHSQFLTSGFAEGFDGFSNNGLDTDADLQDGLMATTGNTTHKGMFKVPTLRNIAVTGPYMHDGRFETLEAVMAHYNHGIKPSKTLSPLILEADNLERDPTAARGLNLEPEEVDAIIAFLHTLTDESFLSDPRFSDPFEDADQ